MTDSLPKSKADVSVQSDISSPQQGGIGQQQQSSIPSQDKTSASAFTARPAGAKEREAVSAQETEEIVVKEVTEPERLVPPETKEVGVEVRPVTPEVPPDLRKLGVKPSGPVQPVIHQGTDKTGKQTATVALPISDDQVVTGLHASIISSLRWLAEWCSRKLKKAHLILKVAHGKVFRVRTR